jgi:putative endonuclease
MVFVYIIKCFDNSLYTGITWNLEKRMKEHIDGKVPFTKNKQPLKLVHCEKFETREMAAAREREIKGWRREKKENLFNSSLH